MKPNERENSLYRNGKRCEISKPEIILFEYLQKHVNSGSRILDIGCGSGEIAQKIMGRGHFVTGLDFSSVAVELAKGLGLDCGLADLDNGIPFDDGTFNAVWAGDIIEHVFDPIFVLKEVKRLLVNRGVLLCTVPYDLKVTTRLRILFGHSFQEGVYRKFGQYKHHTFFSMPLLKYMFKEASLHIQEMKFVIKFPKVRKEFISSSRALAYFAKTVAIRAVSEHLGSPVSIGCRRPFAGHSPRTL